MKRILLCFAACWLTCHAAAAKPVKHHKAGTTVGSPVVLTPRQIARLALPSVVRLTVRDASGSPSVLGPGFVVGPNLHSRGGKSPAEINVEESSCHAQA